jgi:hypothetical protein
VIKLARWKRPLIAIDMNGMVFAMKANTMPAVASARERWREVGGKCFPNVAPQRQHLARLSAAGRLNA